MSKKNKTYEQGSSDGFSSAICFVLGYLNLRGDGGSAIYEDILQECDQEKVISYAREQHEMKFTGLDRYLRNKKRYPNEN